MFAKKQVPSTEQLEVKRAWSVGMLSQLMNPDPAIFPPNHPYWCRFSSGEVKGSRGPGVSGSSTAVEGGGGHANADGSKGVHGKGSGKRMERGGRRLSGGVLAPEIKMNKSAVALPVAWQVQVGGVASGGGGPGMGRLGMENGGGGYRPKGQPVGQALGATDADGDEKSTPADRVG